MTIQDAEFPLLDKDAIVDEGETFTITGQFYDEEAEANIVKSQLSAATLTIRNRSDLAEIASRSILSDIAADGALTLKATAADNVNVGTAVGSLERHDWLITYSWLDSGAVTRTGKRGFGILVRPWATPA